MSECLRITNPLFYPHFPYFFLLLLPRRDGGDVDADVSADAAANVTPLTASASIVYLKRLSNSNLFHPTHFPGAESREQPGVLLRELFPAPSSITPVPTPPPSFYL